MRSRIEMAEIHAQIESLKRGGAASSGHYASLLLAILAPSRFDVDESDLLPALMALRESEANPSAAWIIQKLDRLIVPSVG